MAVTSMEELAAVGKARGGKLGCSLEEAAENQTGGGRQ